MMTIKLHLPLPPSKNKQYGRNRRTGGVYLLPAVRIFREEVWAIIHERGLRKIHTPCRLEAVFHPWRAGRFDQHNRLPQLCDALEVGGLIADDKLFTDCNARLGEIIRPAGACEVLITVLQ